MFSPAKLAANRRNALRSTGPRTIVGSRASSSNATRHGLTATSVVVIRGVEDEVEYEALAADIIADLKPVGAVERVLAERVAQLFWRLRRVLRFETDRLSQQTFEATSSGATLAETVKNHDRRERLCFALGHLFLPNAVELLPETAATILEAFIDCLSEPHRLAFYGDEHAWVSAVIERRQPVDTRFTVGDLLRFLRAAEERLQAFGPVTLRGVPCAERLQPNLIAAVYGHYLGTDRVWNRFDEEALQKLERQRAEALLLHLTGVGVIDRYEPRLRRDLTRTLHDLAYLQDRRRAARCRTGLVEKRFQLRDDVCG